MRLRAWLGLEADERPEAGPLREVLDALDHLDPERARYLARFAYLLGRVAHADRHVSAEETAAMERLVREQGALPPDVSALVVQLAKSSNLLFGGTADYAVALEFASSATYDQKLALARCLFAVAASDTAISLAEEAEIHRILNQLKILPDDLTRLRLQHRRVLPGVSGDRGR